MRAPSIGVCFLSLVACALAERPPNIVFILADDLGWNDVGFHGSNQIPTPNIDALAYSGVILQNYYVSPICTPSRSALMTGRHPVHTGMQHGVLYGADRRGLPLNETLLPERLKRLGYVTRIVGKWHLGSYRKEYTPTFRGFDSHLGGWTGHMDYNDHTAMETGFWGLDIRRNMDVAYDLHGRYATDLFTDEAVRLVNSHDKSKPLFLYLAHNAVHSGNSYNPLPGPDDVVARFDNITVYNRRRFAGMLSKLDESVGKVVQALDRRGILNDTVLVFSTDNGGPAEGFNINAASNYPLRGVKNTLWEGGVRGAALLWSSRIRKPKRVAVQTMHVADWLPTLFSAAGGNTSELQGLDGADLWTILSNDEEYVRKSLLHNIDDVAKVAAIRVGDWKLLKGTTYDGVWDKWYGPSGRDGAYDFSLVANSLAGIALKKLNLAANHTEMRSARKRATLSCTKPPDAVECKPLLQTCLFNIAEDPCEYNNLAEKYPEVVQRLTVELANWNRTAVPPGNLPIDPRGDPKYWNNVFTNFGDYIEEAQNILIAT